MSDRPDPKNGQVTSLTEHRAAKSGGYQESIYDCSYRRGETIPCDNPDLVYFVRVGKVALVTEMQAELGNRQRVTIDYVSQGEPILMRGLFPSLAETQFELIADTDVIVAEIPRASLTGDELALGFLRDFTRLAAMHVVALRNAYLVLLRKLQNKSDQSTNDNMSLQLDLGAAQTEIRKLQEENKRLNGRVSSLEIDLRKAREREVEARELSKEALEFLQALEQRQREESEQVLQIVNDVLDFMGQSPIEPEDLMFILTTASEHAIRLGTMKPSATEIDQAVDALDERVETPADGPLPVRQEPPMRPRLETISFGDEMPTKPSAAESSGYCLVGEQIAQDPPVPTSQSGSLRLQTTAPEDTWVDEPPSSQRGAVMPPPGWDYDDDPSLFEDTKDIMVPDAIRNGGQTAIEIPSQFPRVRPAGETRPAATPQLPPVVMPSPRMNVDSTAWSDALDSWDGSERPTASGQPPANCPPASTPDPQQVGRTTSVWDVEDIRKKAEEARKKR